MTKVPDEAVDAAFAMFHEHGWADHWRCGWEDGPEGERTVPSGDGMCGKEWNERESIREILGLVAPLLAPAVVAQIVADVDKSIQTMSESPVAAAIHQRVRNAINPYRKAIT